MNTATLARINLTLPDKVALEYQKQADAAGLTVEELIAIRLEKCAHHTANRALYFTDTERQALEKSLGGLVMANAAAVLKRLSQIFTYRLTDARGKEVASLQLDDLLIDRLGARAQAKRQPIADYIAAEVKRALMEHCNL